MYLFRDGSRGPFYKATYENEPHDVSRGSSQTIDEQRAYVNRQIDKITSGRKTGKLMTFDNDIERREVQEEARKIVAGRDVPISLISHKNMLHIGLATR